MTTAPAPDIRKERVVQDEAKGLLRVIADLSFTVFITPRIIRWLYIFGIVVSALYAGSWLINSLSQGFIAGIFALMFAPLLFVFCVLMLRVFLEVVTAIFRIAEHLKNNGRKMK